MESGRFGRSRQTHTCSSANFFWTSELGNPAAEQSEAGLQKAAALVVDLFGQQAIRYAVARAVQLEKKGDRIGAIAWQRVLPAIEQLLKDDS